MHASVGRQARGHPRAWEDHVPCERRLSKTPLPGRGPPGLVARAPNNGQGSGVVVSRCPIVFEVTRARRRSARAACPWHAPGTKAA